MERMRGWRLGEDHRFDLRFESRVLPCGRLWRFLARRQGAERECQSTLRSFGRLRVRKRLRRYVARQPLLRRRTADLRFVRDHNYVPVYVPARCGGNGLIRRQQLERPGIVIETAGATDTTMLVFGVQGSAIPAGHSTFRHPRLATVEKPCYGHRLSSKTQPQILRVPVLSTTFARACHLVFRVSFLAFALCSPLLFGQVPEPEAVAAAKIFWPGL